MTTPKTLADMTEAERAQRKGEWHEITWEDTGNTELGILIASDCDGIDSDMLIPTRWPSKVRIASRIVTPRHDLPRAWNPDGTPVEWDVQGADYRPGLNRGFYTLDEPIEKGNELPEETMRARRWVSEWEPADE